MSTDTFDLETITTRISGFGIGGRMTELKPFGSGHINWTYRSAFEQQGEKKRYIHQRINRHVFTRPEWVMENMERVLAHLSRKAAAEGHSDLERRVMRLVPGKDGRPFCVDEDGEYWRTYVFIDNAKSLDLVETPGQAYTIAGMVGKFAADIADLGGKRLHETIANFHDGSSRFRLFRRAIAEDRRARVKECASLIAWFDRRESLISRISEDLARGALAERVTHNDTKANNILLDERTGEGLCVIDLDTVMPGSILYDFGDLVRTSVGTALEDDPDPGKMSADPARFKALAQGFIEQAGPMMTARERELLPYSGRVMAGIMGLRFLTDYLEGDHYYRTTRPGHNLDRVRTQIALSESMEAQEKEMIAACASA